MRAFAVLIVLAVSLTAGSLGALMPRQRLAFEHLRHANHLEMQTIGVAGIRSRGYLAMRVLRRSVAADEAFKELLRTGTVAGQLYGLCGVYDTDPAAFAKALPRYRASTGRIRVISGCLSQDERVSDLVAQISDGTLPTMLLGRDPREADALREEERADFRR